jgi:hypothetical protein
MLKAIIGVLALFIIVIITVIACAIGFVHIQPGFLSEE